MGLRCTASLALVLMTTWGGIRVEAQTPPRLYPLPPHVEEALIGRASVLLNPDVLLLGRPQTPDRPMCATPLLGQLVANWPRLSKPTRETFAVVFARPSTQHLVISPGGHFMIHYDTFGSHAVASTDGDRNGLPDYVDEVARTFDTIWDLQVNEMGHRTPISDGDSYYDVYIRNLAPQSLYGGAWPETFTGHVTSSYMQVDNNYTDSIYQTRGLDGLHVTAAHEFYHAVQFAYYVDFNELWWHELTAVWMEDVVYDDLNDYYQYLPSFFSFPTASLDRFTDAYDLHPFGAAVYAHHIEHLHGAKAIRNTWEVLRERDPSSYGLDDVDAGMPPGGFAGVMPRFAVWNYLTGSRVGPKYYAEAEAYPPVKTETVLPGTSLPVSGSRRVDHLGVDYLRVATERLSGGLRCGLTLGQPDNWTVLVLLIEDGRLEVLWPANPSRIEIPNVNRFQEVVFIPIVTSLEADDQAYQYTIGLDGGISRPSDLVGDFSNNGSVDFADFLAFAGGFGKKPSTAGLDQRLDMDGDGDIDFVDFLTFARHFGE